jgi:hypothetical protein
MAIDITKENPTGAANMGQAPEGFGVAFLEKAKVDAAFNKSLTISSPNNISQGSETVVANQNQNKQEASKTADAVDTYNVNQTIGSLKATLGWKDPNAVLSESEIADVKRQADAAGAEYNPLIESAQFAKQQGIPKALVGAGEKGGFMSSQYSGAAALRGGESFVGAGGELSNIASEYDRNITDLQAKKAQAIALARSTAEKAIRTGRSEDNKAAKELFSLAQAANEQVLDMQKKKLDIISSVRKEGEAKVESGIGNVMNGLTGDPVNDSKVISDAAKLYGVGEDVIVTSVQDYSNKKKKEAVDFLSKKIDIAKDIPQGESYYDADSGITVLGTKRGEEQKITQTIGGNEYEITYDVSNPSKPVELRRFNLGPRWKSNGTGSDGKTNFNQGVLGAVDILYNFQKQGKFSDVVFENVLNGLMMEFPKDVGVDKAEELKALLNERLNNKWAIEQKMSNDQGASEGSQPAQKSYREGLFSPGGALSEENLFKGTAAVDSAKPSGVSGAMDLIRRINESSKKFKAEQKAKQKALGVK